MNRFILSNVRIGNATEEPVNSANTFNLGRGYKKRKLIPELIVRNIN